MFGWSAGPRESGAGRRLRSEELGKLVEAEGIAWGAADFSKSYGPKKHNRNLRLLQIDRGHFLDCHPLDRDLYGLPCQFVSGCLCSPQKRYPIKLLQDYLLSAQGASTVRSGAAKCVESFQMVFVLGPEGRCLPLHSSECWCCTCHRNVLLGRRVCMLHAPVCHDAT